MTLAAASVSRMKTDDIIRAQTPAKTTTTTTTAAAKKQKEYKRFYFFFFDILQ